VSSFSGRPTGLNAATAGRSSGDVERWVFVQERPICWQADPPNVEKIPQDSIIGVTVVLLSCAYKSREFARVGYYVNNDYADPEMRENPPEKIDYSKVCWFCASLLSFNGPRNDRADTCLLPHPSSCATY
jgi:hypothetical protein